MSFEIIYQANQEIVQRATLEFPSQFSAINRRFPLAEWKSHLPRVKEVIKIPAGKGWIGIQEHQTDSLLKLGAAVPMYESLLTGKAPIDRVWTRVDLDTYQIGKYPVTNLQVHQFMHETGYSPVGPWVLFYDDPLHPATGLAQQDVVEYCVWANCRIATEDEWEKAARGPDGAIWPWGDNLDPSKCNCKEAGIGHLTRVDHFAVASLFGICDTSGNVWEMTSSPFFKIQGSAINVMKGGAFSTLLGNCRSSFRISPDGSTKWDRVGIRCVSKE